MASGRGRTTDPMCLGYLRLVVLAGLGLADAKGELETTTFGLFCFGFLGSRLLRRFFWDIGGFLRLRGLERRANGALHSAVREHGHRLVAVRSRTACPLSGA
jgi:hypothetical protein